MLTTTARRHVDFDDLLDLDLAPANDNDNAAPAPATPSLRSLSQWVLRANVSVDSEDNLYAGLSYDVAGGGVFVATYDPPPVGARVDLFMTLPDGRDLDLSGVVRWIRGAELAGDGVPAGCGVEWKGLPVEALRALEDFAAIREPQLWLAEVC